MFPSKYRPEIWSFLLNLPNNEREFGKLVKMGTHEFHKFHKEMTNNLEPK